jgi:hypothetical protein
VRTRLGLMLFVVVVAMIVGGVKQCTAGDATPERPTFTLPPDFGKPPYTGNPFATTTPTSFRLLVAAIFCPQVAPTRPASQPPELGYEPVTRDFAVGGRGLEPPTSSV